MQTTLNYNFKRKSANHLDWLLNIIKSERYFEMEYAVNSMRNNFQNNSTD